MADQYSLLSGRFTVIEEDGDESLPLSGESERRGRISAEKLTF